MDRVDDLRAVDALQVGGAPRGAMRKEMTGSCRRRPSSCGQAVGPIARTSAVPRRGTEAQAHTIKKQTADSCPTGSVVLTSSHGWSCCQPQRSIPTSRRRPPLPLRTRTPPRPGSRSVSARASASPIRNPARQRITISARSRAPSARSSAARITATSSSIVGGVSRVPQAFIPRRPSQARQWNRFRGKQIAARLALSATRTLRSPTRCRRSAGMTYEATGWVTTGDRHAARGMGRSSHAA